MTELERHTWAIIDRVKSLYVAAQGDYAKLYHINNAISALQALRSFLIAKAEALQDRNEEAKKVASLDNKQAKCPHCQGELDFNKLFGGVP